MMYNKINKWYHNQKQNLEEDMEEEKMQNQLLL